MSRCCACRRATVAGSGSHLLDFLLSFGVPLSGAARDASSRWDKGWWLDKLPVNETSLAPSAASLTLMPAVTDVLPTEGKHAVPTWAQTMWDMATMAKNHQGSFHIMLMSGK